MTLWRHFVFIAIIFAHCGAPVTSWAMRYRIDPKTGQYFIQWDGTKDGRPRDENQDWIRLDASTLDPLLLTAAERHELQLALHLKSQEALESLFEWLKKDRQNKPSRAVLTSKNLQRFLEKHPDAQADGALHRLAADSSGEVCSVHSEPVLSEPLAKALSDTLAAIPSRGASSSLDLPLTDLIAHLLDYLPPEQDSKSHRLDSIAELKDFLQQSNVSPERMARTARVLRDAAEYQGDRIQAFRELTSNALDSYAYDPNLAVSTPDSEKRAEITTRALQNGITEWSIKDHGVGMGLHELATQLLTPGSSSNRLLLDESSALEGVRGRFGQGFFMSLGWLTEPGDEITIQSKKDGSPAIEVTLRRDPLFSKDDQIRAFFNPGLKQDRGTEIRIHSQKLSHSLVIQNPAEKTPVENLIDRTYQYSFGNQVYYNGRLVQTPTPKVQTHFPLKTPDSAVPTGKPQAAIPKGAVVRYDPDSLHRTEGHSELVFTVGGTLVQSFHQKGSNLYKTLVIDLPVGSALTSDRSTLDFTDPSARAALIQIAQAAIDSDQIATLNTLWPVLGSGGYRILDELNFKKLRSPAVPAVPELAELLAVGKKGKFRKVERAHPGLFSVADWAQSLPNEIDSKRTVLVSSKFKEVPQQIGEPNAPTVQFIEPERGPALIFLDRSVQIDKNPIGLSLLNLMNALDQKHLGKAPVSFISDSVVNRKEFDPRDLPSTQSQSKGEQAPPTSVERHARIERLREALVRSGAEKAKWANPVFLELLDHVAREIWPGRPLELPELEPRIGVLFDLAAHCIFAGGALTEESDPMDLKSFLAPPQGAERRDSRLGFFVEFEKLPVSAKQDRLARIYEGCSRQKNSWIGMNLQYYAEIYEEAIHRELRGFVNSEAVATIKELKPFFVRHHLDPKLMGQVLGAGGKVERDLFEILKVCESAEIEGCADLLSLGGTRDHLIGFLKTLPSYHDPMGLKALRVYIEAERLSKKFREKKTFFPVSVRGNPLFYSFFRNTVLKLDHPEKFTEELTVLNSLVNKVFTPAIFDTKLPSSEKARMKQNSIFVLSQLFQQMKSGQVSEEELALLRERVERTGDTLWKSQKDLGFVTDVEMLYHFLVRSKILNRETIDQLYPLLYGGKVQFKHEADPYEGDAPAHSNHPPQPVTASKKVVDRMGRNPELVRKAYIAATQQNRTPFAWIKEVVKNSSEAKATHFDLSVRTDQKGHLLVDVEDDGQGVAPDQLHAFYIPKDPSKAARGEDPNFGWGLFTAFKDFDEALIETSHDGKTQSFVRIKRVGTDFKISEHSEPFASGQGKIGTKISFRNSQPAKHSDPVILKANLIKHTQGFDRLQLAFNGEPTEALGRARFTPGTLLSQQPLYGAEGVHRGSLEVASLDEPGIFYNGLFHSDQVLPYEKPPPDFMKPIFNRHPLSLGINLKGQLSQNEGRTLFLEGEHFKPQMESALERSKLLALHREFVKDPGAYWDLLPYDYFYEMRPGHDHRDHGMEFGPHASRVGAEGRSPYDLIQSKGDVGKVLAQLPLLPGLALNLHQLKREVQKIVAVAKLTKAKGQDLTLEELQNQVHQSFPYDELKPLVAHFHKAIYQDHLANLFQGLPLEFKLGVGQANLSEAEREREELKRRPNFRDVPYTQVSKEWDSEIPILKRLHEFTQELSELLIGKKIDAEFFFDRNKAGVIAHTLPPRPTVAYHLLGETYLKFRKMVNQKRFNREAFLAVIETLSHELTHLEEGTPEGTHGPEFFARQQRILARLLRTTQENYEHYRAFFEH